MAVELDFAEDNLRESADDVKPGKCMAVVSEFQEYGAKNGNHICEFEIVAHDDPAEVGKIHQEFFSQTPKAVYRLRQLAIAAGLTTIEAAKAAKEAGQSVPIEFADSVGHPMYVLLAAEEYEKNGTITVNTRVGKGGAAMYRVDDPRCADWPTNEPMKVRGLKMLPANGGGQPATSAPTQSAAPTATQPDSLSAF